MLATPLGTVMAANLPAAFVSVVASASTTVEVEVSNITVMMEANMPPNR